MVAREKVIYFKCYCTTVYLAKMIVNLTLLTFRNVQIKLNAQNKILLLYSIVTPQIYFKNWKWESVKIIFLVSVTLLKKFICWKKRDRKFGWYIQQALNLQDKNLVFSSFVVQIMQTMIPWFTYSYKSVFCSQHPVMN